MLTKLLLRMFVLLTGVLLLIVLLMRPVGSLLPDNDLIVLEVAGDSFGSSVAGVLLVDTRTGRSYRYRLRTDGQVPVFSPDGTQLAFVTTEGFGGEIYVADWTGRGARNISHHPADDVAPIWSPDGTQIAFISRRDLDRELLIADVNTGQICRVVNNQNSGLRFLDVQWSPDGRYLLVNDRVSLTLIDVENGTSSLIDGLDVLAATWSPDSERIAYGVMRGTAMQLHVADVQRQQRRGLDTRLLVGLAPRWSPDSSSLLYVAGTTINSADIFRVEATGGFANNLTTGGQSDIMPAWSPDGTQIVFASMRGNQWEIYVMDADGGDARNLTDHPAHENSPLWSPDGEHILFTSSRDGALRPGVYLMNADGSDVHRIAQVEGAVTVRLWRQ